MLTIRKLAPLLALLVAAYVGWTQFEPTAPSGSDAEPGAGALSRAFDARKSGVQVQGSGIVARLLPDDNAGSRHQRFILQLESGRTLLVAHNIDLAPRIAALDKGDEVEFFGEYEWNPQGGLVHWTHHDPAGRHVAGWLKHAGRTYQ